MNHEQIELAVIIVIEPARGHRPFAALDSGLLRHVLELAISQVVIQNITVHTGYEQIGITVVIEVGSRCAHRIASSCHSGLASNVGKLHPAIISIKAVEVFRRIFFE